MKLAMYKGPAEGFLNKLVHHAICVADTLRTGQLQKYSHVELVLEGGLCCSSSFRDKGVRATFIDFTNGKWDIYEIAEGYDSVLAIDWFYAHRKNKYDWRGIIRFILPFVRQKKDQWFCSEAVAAMLGFSFPENLWPSDVLLLASLDAFVKSKDFEDSKYGHHI